MIFCADYYVPSGWELNNHIVLYSWYEISIVEIGLLYRSAKVQHVCANK